MGLRRKSRSGRNGERAVRGWIMCGQWGCLLEAGSVTAMGWDEKGPKKPQASGLKESSSSRN